MAVSNSVPSSNTPKFDDVVGVILSKEMRRKRIGETSLQQILELASHLVSLFSVIFFTLIGQTRR